jgi:hypothetical protein
VIVAGLEVDGELVLLRTARLDAVEVVARSDDRRDSGLDGVRVEDVAERRREHDAEAVVVERPRRVLARRPAAEVAAGDEDRRALDSGAQLEVGSCIQSKKRNSP